MRKRCAFRDALISAGGVLVLLAALVAVDGRVREQIALRMSPGRASAQVVETGATVRDLTAVMFDAARDQSIEHAPLVLFVLGGTVLLLFMLRT